MKKSYPLRVDESIFNKFQVVADKNHRSVAGHIAFLMEQAIDDYEKTNGIIEVNVDDLNE